MIKHLTSGQETIVLQYLMLKGEVFNYDITVDSTREAEADGQRRKEQDLLTMRMSQRCLAVNADGSYNLEMFVEPRRLVKNGQEVPLETMRQRVTMRMTRTGEILETSLQGPATQPAFPTHPLSVGQTWTGESRVALQDPTDGRPLPPVRLPFRYTFCEITTVMGQECVHIKVLNPETEVPLGSGIVQRIAAHGDTFFAHHEGQLVKSVVETRIEMTLQDGVLRNRIKITVALVPPGAEE